MKMKKPDILPNENRWDALRRNMAEGFLSEGEEQLINNLHNDYLNLNKGYIKLKQKNLELQRKLDAIEKASIQENYWNNKYPSKIIKYLRHETDGSYEIDVRNFFQIYDGSLPKVSGKSHDEIAINALKWVISHIKYTSDKTTYGFNEYWAYPYQTLKRKKGDCDDGSILLANIMVSSGIPYWKVRVNAGNVYDKRGNPAGGHCYVTYYCDKAKRWVAMDWCFFPNLTMPWARQDYKNSRMYGNGEVWFSFNQKYAFTKSTTDAHKMKNIKVRGI